MAPTIPSVEASLPKNLSLFYGGSWHDSATGTRRDTINPGTGQPLASIAEASESDVDAAVRAAHTAFLSWRRESPARRASCLREAASRLRAHAAELAVLDAANTGNPVARMLSDAHTAADSLEYFAGLIPMLKGETIPQAEGTFHYTVREPVGVAARIVAFNHPVMFAGAKIGPPVAAGCAVVIKPPDQAPLSCLRLAEILDGAFPPGVVSVLPGGAECGRALASHPLVRKITLIGSVPTGKLVARAAADSLKGTILELGGKNALVAFPDADRAKLVAGIGRGMNFTWAGQSCGSTSRVFLHESIHDAVLADVVDFVRREFRPGPPTDPATTMGPVINKAAHDRVLAYIEGAQQEGATLALGGKVPQGIPGIEGGFFIEPTIFSGVQPHMRIAKEEIFGPVMSVFKWTDEESLIKAVNDTDYGLTAAVFTRDVSAALDVVNRIEAGYIWVNQVSRHFLNVPFGGVKQSGQGREECLDELFAFTQLKSINIDISK